MVAAAAAEPRSRVVLYSKNAGTFCTALSIIQRIVDPATCKASFYFLMQFRLAIYTAPPAIRLYALCMHGSLIF